MIEILALAIVLLAGLFLLGLAVATFLVPGRAARFLGSFAGSPHAHFLEMAIRIVVGGAFVAYAHHMRFPGAFLLFGWALVVSGIILLLLPWHWHHRFAQRVLPPITNRVWLFGIVALPLSGVILFAVLYGKAA